MKHPRSPRFVKIVAALMLTGIGFAGFSAWLLDNQRDAACERSVSTREDGRAVWLYLVARDPERADDPDVVAFVTFLNDRLPPLECVRGRPTPVTEP